jgi:hypothetical protein
MTKNDQKLEAYRRWLEARGRENVIAVPEKKQ